jgi:hypothetical protein
MTQKDYLLRIAENVGRAFAQILYDREIHDYQGALSLIDELFKQTVGAGSGFMHAVSDETVLAMLTLLGILNVEKALLIATLLKAEGDIYEDQGDPEPMRATSKLSTCFSRSCCAMTICTTYAVPRK